LGVLFFVLLVELGKGEHRRMIVYVFSKG